MSHNHPIHVLLVEDNPTDVLLARDALVDPGKFHLTVVERLGRALELLAQMKFDIVLLDLGLPESQGIDTLLRLRSQYPNIPVVILTTSDDEDLALRAVREGATDYLAKNQMKEGMLARAIRYAIERQRGEAALREKEERIRLLLDSTAEAIFGLDLQGNCTFCNAACVRMLGYSRSNELLGKSIHELIHHSQADGTPYLEGLSPIQNSFLRGKRSHASDEYFWRVDGTKFPVEFWSYPIQRENTIIGGVVTFIDISERRRLEQELRQAQKLEAIGCLAGGVAHDFNNLLTVINGYCEILCSQIPPENPLRKMALEIGQAGERAASLTRQLLAFSRKDMLQPKVLNLNTIVTEMSKMFKRLIGEDIELNAVLDPGLAQVKADRGQMEQVLVNLAVNARDAMPQGGKLTIETANVQLDETYTFIYPELCPGPYVMLSVQDTGCGMDEATQSRIFEPFFTTKAVGKGTGLGLATVYGIVKQSGGHIAAQSEPGQGASFQVYLPVVDEVRTSSNLLQGQKEPAQGTETILLVEDELAVRKLASQILLMRGYNVLEASQGEEALRLAGEFKDTIHLLITDVVMPKMGGRQLAESLAATRPGVKILYISGYTDDAVIAHGILRSETIFLQKPFSPAALVEKVREALGQ